MVRVEVLGVCQAWADDGAPVELSSAQRRLVARLALDAPAAVSGDALAEALWGDDVPATARAALHNQVSRIRKAARTTFIRTLATDYALEAHLDTRSFAAAAHEASELLRTGSPAEAFTSAHTALASWRGTPYVDLDHVPAVTVHRQSLEATRYTLLTTRLAAAVELGRTAWALPEAQLLAAASPHDERRAALLADLLHRSGRRGEALSVIAATRRTLRTGWGAEPGPELVALEEQILTPLPVGRDASLAPFTGRDTELAAALEATRDGGVVRVHGEPGVGVSRFLTELRRAVVGSRGRDERTQVVLVRCASHSDTALAVLEEILDELDAPRGHAGVLADFVPAIATHRAPLVILVDDAHLAGPTTARALLAAAGHSGVTVVLGDRPAREGEPAGVELRLGGLGSEALAVVVRHRLEGKTVTDDATVARLTRAAGGNPLVAELLADSLPGATGEGDDRLTPLVDQWRARLTPAQDAVLEMVAVITGPVPVGLLSALTGTDLAAPDSLLELDPDQRTVRFRHAAVRDVVYRNISPGRRAELHHAVGEAAQRLHLPTAVVAHHRLAAAPLDRRAAVAAALDAASEATQLGAHADAVDWLVRASEHAAALGARELLEVQVALGDAMRLAGIPAHLDMLLDCAERAADAGHVDLLARATFALLQLGGSSDVGAVNARVARVTRRALDVLGDDPATAGIRAAASLAWSMTGEPERARELFLSAERAATAPEVRRLVLPFAYLGLGLPGDVPRRTALAEELVTLAEAADDPVALFEGLQLQVSTRVALADGAGARAALERMHGLIDLVGDVGRRWQLLYLSAAIAHLDGDLDRAEDLAWRALQLLAPVSPARAAAAFHAQVLALRLAQGRLGEVTGILRTLVAEQPAIPAWHAALALSLAHEVASGAPRDDDGGAARPDGTRAELEDHLRAALAHTTEDFTWLASHVMAARAAVVGGAGPDVLDELTARLAPHADLVCWQGTCSYGPVAVPLALLAVARGDAQAPALAARARALCASLGAPVFERELPPPR